MNAQVNLHAFSLRLLHTIVLIWYSAEILRFIIAVQNQRHVLRSFGHVDKVGGR
jgi:hypothetical protein